MSNSNTENVSFCTQPWNSITLRWGGRVQPCCGNSTILGNIYNETIDEIWNGKSMQNVRNLIKDGKHTQAGCSSYCPVLREVQKKQEQKIIPKKWEEGLRTSTAFRENVDIYKQDILDSKIVIDNKPIRMEIQTTEECNMKCIMCHQDHNNKESVPHDIINNNFLKYKSAIYSTRFQGGEVFLDNKFTNYLVNLKNVLPSFHQLKVITNGALLSHNDLDLLTKDSNPVRFTISLDGLEKDVYRKVRKTPHFDKVKSNITYLAKIQNDKNVKLIKWNYVVMKSTFYNIIDAIKLASQLNITLELLEISGDYKDENLFLYRNLRKNDCEEYILKAIDMASKLESNVINLDKIFINLSRETNEK